MSEIRPCGDEQELEQAVAAAAEVVGNGECVVLPTDTVYGIGCDAFSATGVQALLGAKGRTREMPPPVLIARPAVIDGLADQVSQDARALAEAFWPGALTIVCWAQPTLGWDLGETHGTVALRVPDDRVARAVLDRVGPMAVSSANRTGMPAARTAQEAQSMLQDRVPLYLDDGPRPVADAVEGARDVASTIVDCTGETPVVLRHGAITLERLRTVVPGVHGGAGDTETGPRRGNDVSDAVSDATAADQDEPAPQEATDASRKDPTADAGLDSSQNSGAEMSAHAGVETDPVAATALPVGAAAAASAPVAPEVPTADEPRAGDVAPGAEADPHAAEVSEDGATSDEEVITAMVVESAADTAPPSVDQGRDRTRRSEPRWGGTSALSMDEARNLVADPDRGN